MNANDKWGKPIEKPARVGSTVFRAGVGERMVVERAQREYEYHLNPPPCDKPILATEGWLERAGRRVDSAIGIKPAPARAASGWLPMSSAPKDGSRVLAWRADAGVMFAEWRSVADQMTTRDIEREIEESERIGESADWLDQEDWFCEEGGRMEGDEVPTHWMPLPEPPA